MNIFNSLGSNYDLYFVLKSLITFNGNPKSLTDTLEEKYGGKAILLYKGREALELGLKTLNLPEGSFVAINGFTCFAVYDAVKKAGLNCEYLDITSGELNFTPENLKEALSKNKKIEAVIIQNTLGYPCDIEEISKICKKNNLILIEDLAHSVGTKYESGEEAGTVGDLTILSFSQDKIIDGISGGALIVKNKNLSEHLNKLPLAQQTIDRLYPFFTFKIRINYPFYLGKIIHKFLKTLNLLSKPMNEIDSNKLHVLPNWYTVLIRQGFDRLSENLSHRKKIAAIYAKLLNPKVLSPKIISSLEPSTNLRFPIFVNNRQELIKYIARNGVYISDIWYDGPIAPKKYMPQTDYNNQCPNSELASSSILNLPTHQKVHEQDAEVISNLINQWLTSQ